MAPDVVGPLAPLVPPARPLRDGRVISRVEWFETLGPAERARAGSGVLRKPTRTLSGVAIVAVMTSPSACPHGRCTYCPGGPSAGTPQSYTGEEPSALRGAQYGWDAQKITVDRLRVLERIGHPTSKVEAIVMGGTFPARPAAYRRSVVQGILDGLNGSASTSLAEAQRSNESAAHRLVGLTVETRPDWCDDRVLPDLVEAGVTRVEIGVECLDEAVLADVHRAHGVTDVAVATRAARSRGLKIAYHMMLGLPGMDPSKDLEGFRRLFQDPELMPDMLKIYPTLVLPGTELHERWRSGRYAPYDLETTVELLARIKAELPPWVRVQRIQRDIPARLIAEGVRTSNVRELAQRAMARGGRRCRCLRCREVGRRPFDPSETFGLTRTRYRTPGGTEEFFAFEGERSDAVAGFLRLRVPDPSDPGPLGAPVIRELKVLGPEVAVGEVPEASTAFQHRGLGRALVAEAERVARSAGFDRLAVRSAIGTRPYYRRLGFVSEGAEMTKPLFA